MKIVIKLFNFIIAIICALLFIAGLMQLIDGGSLVRHTINNSHKIEESFASSVVYINHFQEQSKRLPTQAEFDQLAKTQEQSIYGVKGIQILTNNYPKDIITSIGAPTENSYLLLRWRGEWYEYYAPWNNATSLTYDPKDYYMAKYWWADALLFFGSGICLFLVGFIVERRLTISCSGCYVKNAPHS